MCVAYDKCPQAIATFIIVVCDSLLWTIGEDN